MLFVHAGRKPPTNQALHLAAAPAFEPGRYRPATFTSSEAIPTRLQTRALLSGGNTEKMG